MRVRPPRGAIPDMPVTYSKLAEFLHLEPRWNGFDDCSFDFELWSLDAAIADLRVCMDKGASTVEAYAKNDSPYLTYVDNFDATHPVMLVAVSRDVLHQRWAAEYPAPGPELIVTDGNHRIVSLARRKANGGNDAVSIGVFACRA